MNFPLSNNTFRGLPINAHPGSFGHKRTYYTHTGIDLYGEKGDEVYAISDGVVIRNEPFTGEQVGTYHWLNTSAVMVGDKTGYYVYGELESTLSVGDIVNAGSLIGKLLPVLPFEQIHPEYPGHSNVMLHLERLSLDYNPADGWIDWWNGSFRANGLIDPTPALIEAYYKTFKQVPKFLVV